MRWVVVPRTSCARAHAAGYGHRIIPSHPVGCLAASRQRPRGLPGPQAFRSGWLVWFVTSHAALGWACSFALTGGRDGYGIAGQSRRAVTCLIGETPSSEISMVLLPLAPQSFFFLGYGAAPVSVCSVLHWCVSVVVVDRDGRDGR